jgi:hypothetical protein
MSKPNFWPKPPKQVGNRWEYGSLTFWAEGGGIYIIDAEHRPDEAPQKSVMLPGWKQRLDAQMRLLAHVEKTKHVGEPSTVAWKVQYCRALSALVSAMFEVGCQANEQGDLSRPEVQEYYRKHVASVKQTHLVPGVILPH